MDDAQDHVAAVDLQALGPELLADAAMQPAHTLPQISPIPDRRHSVQADEDSVVMLSVAVPQRAPDAR